MGGKKGGVGSVLLLAGVLISSPAWALEATLGPILTMDPSGVTPLAGVMDLETDVPTRVVRAMVLMLACMNVIPAITRSGHGTATFCEMSRLRLKPLMPVLLVTVRISIYGIIMEE